MSICIETRTKDERSYLSKPHELFLLPAADK